MSDTDGTEAAVTARTRLFCLLGDPVKHSLSPAMQNAAFREAGVDGVYVALRCSGEDLPALVRSLSRAGGGGNVTLPHKERAASVVDVPSEAVRRTGACNTFWWEDGSIHGDNTDVEGFRRALHDFRGGAEADRVLLLGAGGAARAALVALIDEGVGEVRILNRTVERARAVARRIGGKSVRVAEGPDEIRETPFDLVVNATRLGLSRDDPLPIDLDAVGELGGVLDLVYGEDGTPLTRQARSRGIPASDGGGMLARQGAVSFERWWERPAPLDTMQRCVEARRGKESPIPARGGEE